VQKKEREDIGLAPMYLTILLLLLSPYRDALEKKKKEGRKREKKQVSVACDNYLVIYLPHLGSADIPAFLEGRRKKKKKRVSRGKGEKETVGILVALLHLIAFRLDGTSSPAKRSKKKEKKKRTRTVKSISERCALYGPIPSFALETKTSERWKKRKRRKKGIHGKRDESKPRGHSHPPPSPAVEILFRLGEKRRERKKEGRETLVASAAAEFRPLPRHLCVLVGRGGGKPEMKKRKERKTALAGR